ncbi:helix-turn-helix transcriptional regulator [Ruminococcus sp.]|uniref:helix-turn-helix transcriptional regulator n=1 Tax=Ruminococcus sp. TaxID=41978 RepID=UPI0025F1D83B|nr:helix-turn-helix transcriptional regulator [Ruminococcus sp.]MCR4638250.1 helix-turn-helix domain-containing protein [Ruminococcus sp.]
MAKYPDLKSYLQSNYIELFTSEIQKFVDNNYDGGGFHSINVLSLLKHKIENVEVKALKCHDAPGPIVKMDVGLSADIVELGLGTKKYEADRKCRWFTVYLQGILRDGLVDVKVLKVKEYHNGAFEKDNALDQFLVPYIYTATLEETADDFTEFYCADAIYDAYMLPIDHILQQLEIRFYMADLPDNCFGRMYFRKSKATVYEKYPMIGEVKREDYEIEPGTILISRQKYYLGSNGTHRLTIAHEIIHWHLHKKYYQLLALLDDQSDMMSCEVEPSHYEESMTMAQKAHWYAEWQANALALRIAMPQHLMVRAMEEAYDASEPYHYKGELVEDMLKRVAMLFDVPRFAAKQRARQLGWDVADGAFVYVDGKWHQPFYFPEGILEQYQTFVIDKNGFDKIYSSNADFAELIDSGKYLYIGYVVCINDPKYLKARFIGNRVELELSDYACEHADECCLVFSFKSTSYLREMQDKYEFYGESYLSKEVKSENYVEHYYDKNFNQDCLQNADELKKEIAAILKAQEKEDNVFLEMQQNHLTTFGATLEYHRKRKKHITLEQLAERSGLSVTTIKNYRSGKSVPPIENVMAVCIGLNLPKAYSLHLLKTCSYSLGDSPRDRAYRLCLDYDEGTLEQWNMILAACSQPMIPDNRNQ